MVRYFVETSKVDVRMVHQENGFSFFGDSGGLLDEYGFLRDPQWMRGLKTLADVAAEQAVVIIAESGLGKSYIAREFAKKRGVDAVLFIDVQEYRGDPQGLVAAMLAASDKQFVCLDGLDEAEELASAIVRGFRSLPSSVKRLIFSRCVPGLRQFTEDGGFKLYSLLPLTQEDVKSLAGESGVDREAFIAEVKLNLYSSVETGRAA